MTSNPADGHSTHKAFPALFQGIRNAVIASDPTGLFSLGVPLDEHDDLIHRIISGLGAARQADDVEAILDNALRSWIDAAGGRKDGVVGELSPVIWHLWQNFRQEAN